MASDLEDLVIETIQNKKSDSKINEQEQRIMEQLLEGTYMYINWNPEGPEKQAWYKIFFN